MKNALIVIILFILAINVSISQENYPISYGPQVSMKFGINGVETPLGRKNGVALANLPDVGATIYLPLSNSNPLGLTFDLRYSPYSFFIIEDATDLKYQHNFSYFLVNSGIFFKGITFGFSLGLPLSADVDGATISTDELPMMSEVQIGYTYPIWEDETGRFNIFIKGTYFLSQMFNDFPKNDPMKKLIPEFPEEPITNNSNPRAVTVYVGFNYLFNLNPPIVFDEE